MEEIYEYNGERYTLSELTEKYGDKVQSKIQEHGFKKIEPKVYSYKGEDYTEFELQEKYGDKLEEKIKEHGFVLKKKEDSTSATSELDSEPKEETTSLESESKPLESPTNEQYNQALIKAGYSQEEIDQRNKENQSKDLGYIKQTQTFEKDNYDLSERKGLSGVESSNEVEAVEIDGFDNEKMIALNQKLKESGTLSVEELKNIDAEIDRKRRGDLTLWERFKTGPASKIPFIGEKKEDYLKTSKQDREEAIYQKIRNKQADFFSELDPDEKEMFTSYLVKRNEKLSTEYALAESFNKNLIDKVLPNEIAKMRELNEQLKSFSELSEDTITEEQLLNYNNLLEQKKAQEEVLTTLNKQFESNRKTQLDGVDDILSFEDELDLAKRDYSWWKNNVSVAADGAVNIFRNSIAFTGNVLAEGLKNDPRYSKLAPELSKIQNALSDWSKEIQISKHKFEDSIAPKKSFSDVENIGDFSQYVGNLFAEQIPILATIATTGGAGLAIVSMSSGGDRYGQLALDDSSEYTNLEKLGNGLLYAGGEFIGENITLGLMKNYKNVFKSINKNETLKRTFKENLKANINGTLKGLKTANSEGLSEVYTEAIQLMADNIQLDEKRDSQFLESYISGFIMGEGIHIAGTIPSLALGAYSRKQNRDKVRSNTLKIMELQKVIKEGDFTKEVSDLYESKIKSLENENNSIINESVDDLKKLNPKQITKITAINSKIKAVQLTLQDAKTESVKQSLLTQINDLSTEKENLLNPEINKDILEEAKKIEQPKTNTQENEIVPTEKDTKTDKDALEELIQNPENEEKTSGDIITDKDIQSSIKLDENKRGDDQIQPSIEPKRDRTEIKAEIKKGKNSYNVINENGNLVVRNSKGKTPSKTTERQILKEYAETFDFTDGEKYKAPEGIVDETSFDFDNEIAENSNNPAELAELALKTKSKDFINENSDQEALEIINYISGNVKRGKKGERGNDGSFVNQSDANNITFAIAKTYLKSDGRGLDVLAQELSDILGREITEQDIIDVMLQYPNGENDVKKEVRDKYSNPAKKRFSELTGFPSSDYYLEKAVEQYIAKEKLDREVEENYLHFLTYEELLSLQQEYNQYEKTTYKRDESATKTSNPKKSQGKSRDNEGLKRESEELQETGRLTSIPLKTFNKLINRLKKAFPKIKINTNKKEFFKRLEELGYNAQLQVNGSNYFSSAKVGLSKIPQKSATPDQWVKMISDKGGKGTAQELEWIGLEDYLNSIYIGKNKADVNDQKAVEGKYIGSIPKEVVEQYIEDNQIEIQEIVKKESEDAYFNMEDYEDFPKEVSDIFEKHVDDQHSIKNDLENIGYNVETEADGTISSFMIKGTKNPSKYKKYTLEGGENYREVLLTLPNKNFSHKIVKLENGEFIAVNKETGNRNMLIPQSKDKSLIERFIKSSEEQLNKTDNNNYKSSHFDESNILAHVRLNERTLPNGERVLFIEEIQSDWAQDGKKKGFKKNVDKPKSIKKLEDDGYSVIKDKNGDFYIEKNEEIIDREDLPNELKSHFDIVSSENLEAKNNNLIPDMPYKKTDQWVGMAFRRVMQMATQEGFDRVAWVTGEQSADRYDLSKQVDSIKVSASVSNLYKYNVTTIVGGVENDIIGVENDEKLEATLGKDLAKKISEDYEELKELNKYGDAKEYKGDDLKVGGEGMEAFYNSILPKVAKKEAQRFDKKATIDIIEIDQTSTSERIPENEFSSNAVLDVLKGEKSKQLSIKLTDPLIQKISKNIPLFLKDNKGEIYGYLDVENGTVYLNPENINANTPIHEFGHVWVNALKVTNKGLFKKGIELIKGTKYHEDTKNNPSYSHLTEEQILEESLVAAIGDKGESFIDKLNRGKFRKFLENLKTFLTERFFINQRKNINKLSLDQFLNGAISDILGGKEIKTEEFDLSKVQQDELIKTNNIDSVIDSLNSLNESLTKYGKENLSFGLPVAVAQASVRAMLLTAKTAKTVVEIINAGSRAIKESEWYKNLNKAEKSYYEDLFGDDVFLNGIGTVMNEIKRKEKQKSDQRAKRLKDTSKRLREKHNNLRDYKKSIIDEIFNRLKLSTIESLDNHFNKSLFKKINQTRSHEALDKLISAVDYKIAKEEVNHVDNAIKGILKLQKSFIKKVDGKAKANIVDNETRKIFKSITSLLKQDYNVIASRLNDLQSNMEGKDPKAQLSELLAAEIALKLKEGEDIISSIEGNSIENIDLYNSALLLKLQSFEYLDELLNDGRSSLKQEVLREAIRLKEIQERAVEETNHKYNDVTDNEKNIELHKRKNSFFKKIIGTNPSNIKQFFTKPVTNSFEFLLGFISQTSDHGKGFLYKYFYSGDNGIVQLDSNFKSDQKNIKTELKKAFKRILKKKNNTLLSNIKYQKEFNTEKINTGIWLKDEENQLPLSINQALYVHLVSKMPGAKAKLEAQGWANESFNQLNEFLGPEYIELSDYMTEYLRNKYDKYNETYESILRTDLGFEEGYFPLKYIDVDLKMDINIGESNISLPSVSNGHLKTKVSNNNRIDISVNALEVFNEYLDSMERFHHYARFIKDLNSVLSNSKIRNNIKTFSEESFSDLRTLSKAVVGDKSDIKASHVESKIYRFNSAIAAGYIGFKGYTALKQFLSMPAYTEFANDIHIAFKNKKVRIPFAGKLFFGSKMIANFNPYNIYKSYNFLIKNSNHFKNRIDKGDIGDEFINELMSRRNQNWMNQLFRYIAKKGISPNKAIDMITISTGGMVYYSQQYKKYKSFGVEESLAKKRAIRDFEIAFKLTQQSSDASDLSIIQHSKGVLTSLFVPFKNAQFSYFRRISAGSNNILRRYTAEKEKQLKKGVSERKAKLKALNIIKKADTHKDLENIVLYTHILPLIWQYVASGLPGLLTDWDDEDVEEMKRAGYLGLFDGVFILGDLLKYGYDVGVRNKNWTYQTSIVFGQMEKTLKEIKDVYEETGEYNMDLVLEIAKGYLTTKSINLDSFNNIYRGVEQFIEEEEITQEGIMKILNAPKELRGD